MTRIYHIQPSGSDPRDAGAFNGFASSVPGGGKEIGVIVCGRGSGSGLMEKQDFIFYTLADDEKVHWRDRKSIRRDKASIKYDYEKLWRWVENGRETVYTRKE